MITIPSALVPSFGGSEPVRVCDENGPVLGYFTPRRKATEEDYQLALENISTAEVDAALASGPGRPLREVLDELRRNHGP